MNNINQNARHRNYCFTINNPTDAQRANLLALRENDVASYFVSGNETGDNGTSHLQGYIEFARQYRFRQVRAFLPGAHIEPRRGSQEQAITYCKKDGDYIEDGLPRAQGARHDLEAIKALILTQPGDWKHDTARDYFGQFIRYHTGLSAAAKALNQETVDGDYKLSDFSMDPLVFTPGQPYSHVLHGPSGIGKTQFALAHFENPLFVSHMDDLLQYTPSYDGIVFDDMSFTHLPRTAQIHLVDSGQARSIHCRYRTARIPRRTPKIFTTNEAFGAIFLQDQAINRRIVITEMEADQWILPPPPIPVAPPLPALPQDSDSDDDDVIILDDLPGNQLQVL